MRHRHLLRAAGFLILTGLLGCNSAPRNLNVSSFGATSDGKTKTTAAIQQALDQCVKNGGGEVVIGPGKYLVGSLRMGSNTTLRLSEGATLLGSPDPDDYPLVPVRYEGETVQGHQALISASHANHISIVGPGTLQGDMTIGDLRRPRAPVMIEFEDCSDIQLEDFHDRYRRMWSIHLLRCRNVIARNLNIRTTKTNGDGIDVDSTTDVTIDHCDIDTGDDAIALKSGRGAQAVRAAQPSKNILITHCTLGSNFAGVGIGTEMSGGVSNVQIKNCTFTRGDNAIFLKSRLGRGGAIENISADTIDTSSKTCLGINLVNKGIVGSEPVLGADGIPSMQNIRINNVTIHAGKLLDGLNVPVEKPIDGLHLTNVSGNCASAISLANTVHAKFENIHVTGFRGPLIVADNVTGSGLEGAVPPGTSGVQQLRDSFISPPDEARPMVRWWWFGPAVTKPELQREIEAMKAGGFGGFEVQPTYPLAVDGADIKNLPLLSPEFLDDLNFVATTAKQTGMRMDLTLGSGWPYGGPQFSLNEAAGKLRIAKAQATPGQTEVSLPALKSGESLIAAFAGNDELKTLDQKAILPPSTSTGTSTSEVLFFIASRTGMKVKRPALGGEGYVIDHDNLAVVSKFIDQIGNKEVEACGSNLPYAIFCDSLEVYGQDWTDQFLNEFQTRRGYDLRPLLPALVAENDSKSSQIRHDWGQTLTEVFNDSFIKPLRSLAEDHKILLRMQAYGTPSAGLFSYAFVDLPEGEGYQWHGYRATRYASSATHLMNIPVCSSEAFTWIHNVVFRATPLDIKAEADLHFLQGVNQLICHGWPYTPAEVNAPGWSFYAAGVFDDKNPWYPVMVDVNKYLTRMSALLRQGKPANDVAVYLANDDAWSHFSPGHVSLSDGVGQQLGDKIVGQILDGGYNLDFFDDPMLERFGKIDGGGMVFGDLRYKVIVLAGVQRMPLATLQKLEAMARAGGVVIATRSKPCMAPGYKSTDAQNQEIRDISQRLFDAPGAPGIFVADENDLAAALLPRLAPDVKMIPATPAIGFVHRHTDFADIYFLTNTSNRSVTTRATFRVEGLIPQQWNPISAFATAIAIADHPPGGTALDISLDAYESTVIVWTTAKAPVVAASNPIQRSTALDLSTDWQIQFPSDNAPAALPTLRSWTQNPAKRTFSGVCRYTKTFELSQAQLRNAKTIELNFGSSTPTVETRSDRPGHGFFAAIQAPVREAAVVFVNRRRVGAVWAPPYSIDLTPYLKPGTNTLRIEVANIAVNAISAQSFPNYDSKSLIEQFGERFPVPKASDFQPVTSGLLGPISLQFQP